MADNTNNKRRIVICGKGGGQAESVDWNDIENKPEFATVATSGDYDDLTNKPTIPAAQVNSDWNANSGVSQILNKPNLATVATSGSYSDLSNTPNLATVATSGDYNDLTNKPTIPTVPTNVSAFTNDAGYLTQHQSLAGYATENWVQQQGYSTFSGDYDDLTNKPTIPAAQVNSDWNASSGVSQILNKPAMATETLTFTLQGGTTQTITIWTQPTV